MRRIIFLLFLGFCVLLFSQKISAHSGGGIVEDYIVTFKQEPLSPFVGEEVSVKMTITDKSGKAVDNLAGNLVLKQLHIKEYLGESSEDEYKILHQEAAKTGVDGTIPFKYVFEEDAVYDLEFIWGEDVETESAGYEIHPRNPTSFFDNGEALRRIWVFVAVGLIGVAIGATGAFVLLTMTLRPKE